MPLRGARLELSAVVEIFGNPVGSNDRLWADVVEERHCPYIDGPCHKLRKTDGVPMGTCVVEYSKRNHLLVICPSRMHERMQVFVDCMHLLTNHQPGNEFHLVPEFAVPGGSVDFILVSARSGRAMDFVGVELQTLDTTGDWWPLRQWALRELGVPILDDDVRPERMAKPCGINWKMTAKTILVQIHHKTETFQAVNRKLVLVLQDRLLDYMQREFAFDHFSEPALAGDSMHIHAYAAVRKEPGFRLDLAKRLSTDAAGVATSLGLQAEPNLEIEDILDRLTQRMRVDTRFEPV